MCVYFYKTIRLYHKGEHILNVFYFQNSRLILFVIDPTTINATSYLEIAHIAARQMPKMVVVFLNQLLWQSNGLPEDRSDRKRVCETLDDILTMHHVPVLHTIKVISL